jgi:hypothetical protein
MKPQLQRFEIEAVRRRNDDLAVDDRAFRHIGRDSLVELGEVAIERTKVAALNENFRAVPEHYRAKPIPLWLVHECARREFVGETREHRFDGRRDCEIHR